MMESIKTILTPRIMTEKRTINNVNIKNKWQVVEDKAVRTEDVLSEKDINEFWTTIISHGIAPNCFKHTQPLTM